MDILKNKKVSFVFLGNILFVFLIGFLFHNLYHWLGENTFIGFIVPINESIFEHLKLILVPMIIYYVLSSIIVRNKDFLDIKKYIFTIVFNILISMFLIVDLYYFFSGAFGLDSMILDILIFLIALVLSNYVSLMIYYKIENYNFIWSICLTICLLILFIIFTINPPILPIFISK